NGGGAPRRPRRPALTPVVTAATCSTLTAYVKPASSSGRCPPMPYTFRARQVPRVDPGRCCSASRAVPLRSRDQSRRDHRCRWNEGVVGNMAIPNPYLGEVVGTATLILLGDGVVAGVLLNKSKAQNSGWIVITWAWGLAVFMGVITSLAVTGGQAHLNPAVTIGLWALGYLKDWTTTQIVLTIVFEFVGAMIGALLVWLSYLPHWPETEDPGLKLAVFCTGPAIRNTGANLITEIVGTFMLVFGVVAIAIKFSGGLLINVAGMTGSMTVGGVLATGALPVALLVLVIGLALGGP